MDSAILYHYRRLRAHQLSDPENYSLTTYRDGRRSGRTFGGAAYGQHAASALAGARRHLAFVARLGETVAQHKKRSRAARKGWAKRRAAA